MPRSPLSRSPALSPGCRDQVEHERYRPVQAGKQGDYVSQGAILFDVANLTKVWALFDAFEVDLPFLSKGDPVEFTLQALPGKKFSGKISFIDPILNTTTRTAKVRVEVPNASLELKPEMYATANVSAPLPQL